MLVRTVATASLHPSLEADTSYFVLEVSSDVFRVIDRDGQPYGYSRDLFALEDSAVPRGWCFQLSSEDEYHLCPCAVNVPGFYERLFCSDGEREAEAETHRVLEGVIQDALSQASESEAEIIRRDLERFRRRRTLGQRQR